MNLSATIQRRIAALNYIWLLAALAVISAILIAAMTIQYVKGELPCPLCLLERLALFGVAYGIIRNLRGEFSYQNTGICLLFTIFLLVVSARQSLLDIYPRPGHEYIGSAVFGIHMPVWSIIISLCLLTAFAAKLAVLGSDTHLRDNPARTFLLVARATDILGLVMLALCAINLISVLVQCGFGQCHTTGYALLGG